MNLHRKWPPTSPQWTGSHLVTRSSHSLIYCKL